MASSSGLPWYTNDPEQPVRAVDLEVGAAEGELLAVGRMMDEAVAPAGPEIELVDHSSRWGGPTSGQMLGLGVEPEDQLRWRRHDVPERNHLLIGRCWGSASRSSGRGGLRSRPSRLTSAGSACGFS